MEVKGSSVLHSMHIITAALEHAHRRQRGHRQLSGTDGHRTCAYLYLLCVPVVARTCLYLLSCQLALAYKRVCNRMEHMFRKFPRSLDFCCACATTPHRRRYAELKPCEAMFQIRYLLEKNASRFRIPNIWIELNIEYFTIVLRIENYRIFAHACLQGTMGKSYDTMAR